MLFLFVSIHPCWKLDLGMSFVRHPEPIAAPLGDEVYFECSLNLPAEKFVWRHRPLNTDRWGPLIQASNSAVKTSKHVVFFDDKSKAGDYQCIAYYGIVIYTKILLEQKQICPIPDNVIM